MCLIRQLEEWQKRWTGPGAIGKVAEQSRKAVEELKEVMKKGDEALEKFKVKMQDVEKRMLRRVRYVKLTGVKEE